MWHEDSQRACFHFGSKSSEPSMSTLHMTSITQLISLATFHRLVFPAIYRNACWYYWNRWKWEGYSRLRSKPSRSMKTRIMVQNLKLMQHRYSILLFLGRPVKKFQDIEWLRSITSLPILLKGVLTPEDAIKAMEVGVAGIIVSNHGARQLDYSPATIIVLEEVLVAVGGKIPALLDGGIRRGTDIFKALALGAKAVMIGRLVLYGLAAKGEQGVRQVMEMLKNELELTMALSGCPTLKDITRSQQTQLETLG